MRPSPFYIFIPFFLFLPSYSSSSHLLLSLLLFLIVLFHPFLILPFSSYYYYPPPHVPLPFYIYFFLILIFLFTLLFFKLSASYYYNYFLSSWGSSSLTSSVSYPCILLPVFWLIQVSSEVWQGLQDHPWNHVSGMLRLTIVAYLNMLSQYFSEEAEKLQSISLTLADLRSGSRNPEQDKFERGVLTPQLRHLMCGNLLPLLLTGLHGLVVSRSGNCAFCPLYEYEWCVTHAFQIPYAKNLTVWQITLIFVNLSNMG
jgi:hypothetical protein